MHRVVRDQFYFSYNFDDDIVVTCFGEIDIRCHVYKHNDVEGLVKGYCEMLGRNREAAGNRIIAMMPPPPCRYSALIDNEKMPVRGSDAERLAWHRRIRRALHKGWDDVLDVTDWYADGEGMLNPALSDGNVHIGDIRGVVKELERIGAL
jgi:hypothetical protein